MRRLPIEGAWVDEPRLFPDSRGSFHEWFKAEAFAEATGHGWCWRRPTARCRPRARCAASTSPTCRPARRSTSSACAAPCSTWSWTSGSGSPTFGHVGGGAARRRDHRAVLPLRGARARLHGADRRRHGRLPVLARATRPAARARHPPARPGSRHRLARGRRAAAVRQGRRRAHARRGAARRACCRRTRRAARTTRISRRAADGGRARGRPERRGFGAFTYGWSHGRPVKTYRSVNGPAAALLSASTREGKASRSASRQSRIGSIPAARQRSWPSTL